MGSDENLTGFKKQQSLNTTLQESESKNFLRTKKSLNRKMRQQEISKINEENKVLTSIGIILLFYRNFLKE